MNVHVGNAYANENANVNVYPANENVNVKADTWLFLATVLSSVETGASSDSRLTSVAIWPSSLTPSSLMLETTMFNFLVLLLLTEEAGFAVVAVWLAEFVSGPLPRMSLISSLESELEQWTETTPTKTKVQNHFLCNTINIFLFSMKYLDILQEIMQYSYTYFIFYA
jgi:hypothetical protein